MLDDTYYRGQTKNGKLLTRFVMSSFTDSHDIATIYASNEGRDFSNDANVVTARLRITNPLDLSQYGPISTFYDLLTNIGYLEGKVSFGETVKVLNHMANRKRAKALGGVLGVAKYRSMAELPSFEYQLKNEEDTEYPLDEDEEEYIEIPFSLTRLAIDIYRSMWQEAEYADKEYQTRLSLLLGADVFAFIETPATKRALEALGYDGVIYMDRFASSDAAERLLDKVLIELDNTCELDRDYDWEELSEYDDDPENVIGHITVRPFRDDQVEVLDIEWLGKT